MISSAVESCGRKRLRMAAGSEKRTPWWNQNVKEAIRAKKDAFKTLLQNRSSSDLPSQYSEEPKAEVLAVKMSKQRSGEEFGCLLDSNYSSASKVFERQFAARVGKI